MESLPDEIFLHILSFLEPSDLVRSQFVSRPFLRLARDNALWRQLCFENSVAERRRRRQDIPNLDQSLADLVRAADSITDILTTTTQQHTPLSAHVQVKQVESRKKTLSAYWDPSYPEEKVDFYQEYIQRHAPSSISWFQGAQYGHEDDHLLHEATGAGILLNGSGVADKLVAPLDDGSISIWDIFGQERHGGMVARSSTGLLANKGSDLDFDTRLRQSQAIMTETGAVECVSIDSEQKKGIFAVQNILNEVDLQTLQVITRTPYPFPITVLSEARHPTPVTVGTNWTIHLHDTRAPPALPHSVRTELIGGTPSEPFVGLPTGEFGSHVSLAQPGPQSILHLPTTLDWNASGDIWVGGRFTSFLNFDRRFFPRLRGTVHSGARLSSLSAIPHPFVPHNLRFGSSNTLHQLRSEAKCIPGITLVAAGEYKGKGSLELYGLSSDPTRSINASDSRTTRNQQACYQNRQTASRSKLLSVAPHGTRLVFSDGDGYLKWVERDGSTPVRQININDDDVNGNASTAGLPGKDDIVQKIIPTVSTSLTSSAPENVPLGRDNLIVWTGDGRLGMVGFGEKSFDFSDMEDEAKEEEARNLRAKERDYGAEMRRALEHQARELRWMRGYGL